MKISSLFILLSCIIVASAQRARKRNVRNETKTVNVEKGGSVIINNIVNCGPDNNNLDDKACPLTSYLFPQRQQTSDYIRVKTPIPDMISGSVCAWLSTGDDGMIEGTLLSYATAKQFNSFIIIGKKENNTSQLDVFINDEGYFGELPLPVNKQIHLCAVFSTKRGYVKIYTEGVFRLTITDYKKRAMIEGGGIFIIGQEQDGLASGFMPDQAYHGKISNFMLWDRELKPQEIRAMSKENCECPNDYFATLTPDTVTLMGGVAAQVIKNCPATK